MDSDKVIALLVKYWDAAYAEGREGRSHDTEDGVAQQTFDEILAAFSVNHKVIELAKAIMEVKRTQGRQCGKALSLTDELLDAIIPAEKPVEAVDWSKPIQRRDGRKAIVLEILPHISFGAWVAEHPSRCDGWNTRKCRLSGRVNPDHEDGADIINVPEPAPEPMELEYEVAVAICKGKFAVACREIGGDGLITFSDGSECHFEILNALNAGWKFLNWQPVPRKVSG
jgi:hypothetical protein